VRNNTFDYKHPFTVWEEIKTDIEIGIINNVYNVGEKVPSINQISQDYNVSSSTAVKVLESMRNDDTILKKRGVGYFVMPYVKDKLIKKHRTDFNSRIVQMVLMARKIGYQKDEFTSTVLTEIERVWKTKKNENPHGEDNIQNNKCHITMLLI